MASATAALVIQQAGVALMVATRQRHCPWPLNAHPPAVANAAQAVAQALVGEARAGAVQEAQGPEATSANAKSIHHTSATTGHRPAVSPRDAFNKANDSRDERGRNEK